MILRRFTTLELLVLSLLKNEDLQDKEVIIWSIGAVLDLTSSSCPSPMLARAVGLFSFEPG